MKRTKEILIAKFGSKCIVDGESIDQAKVDGHARRYDRLLTNYRLGIVSSGSKANGSRILNEWNEDLADTLDERTVTAIGSSGAYQSWQHAFARMGRLTAELKATHANMDDEQEGKSLVEVFLNCVNVKRPRIIPVFNINDVLDQQRDELGKIKEGKDNDFAAEHLARKTGANTLMLMTAKVRGVLIDGEVQPRISISDMDELRRHFTGTDEDGTGSMVSKVEAGARALTQGEVDKVFIGSSAADPWEILAGNEGTEVVQ